MKDRVIQIVGLVNGGQTEYDGQYVVEYDPGRDGVEPLSGSPMRCHLVTTPDIEKATRYEVAEVHTLWTAIDPREPVRPDGKPNRPLTAFTVMVEKIPAQAAS